MGKDWIVGIKAGVGTLLGSVAGRIIGKSLKLDDNDIKSLESFGTGIGIGLSVLSTSSEEKNQRHEAEVESEKHTFRNRIKEEKKSEVGRFLT